LTIHANGKAKVVKATQDKGQAQLVAAFLDAARPRACSDSARRDRCGHARTLAIEDALRGKDTQ